MRTLKKTLSLLLAVALVLSLTVVGASAAYTGNKVDTLKDAADVGADYSEAVGVMVGLGIIEGYDDGTLRPETTYTREQAAKIIAYMQLGPKDADSLRCTKAPFTDVAADRWSAGYIAYCVEQGIIDGMGDGTFQPEAQLTGYQWAKMLLCAVGYGRNDEYVGNSWSLNTAKDALDKGIFDGDLDGADHVVLTRQQAILYAFNTLTAADVVVYSPSLGDYIAAYGKDIIDRVTIEGTLGEKVYGLGVTEGIIVDNEGMGNSKTVVSTDNKYDLSGTEVEVAAGTDIDMMYHAAKIWHVGSGKTAIYVIDKATVTALTCNNITSSAVAKLEKSTTVDRTIGTDYGYDYYEYNFVDNGDLGTAGVSFYYDLGTLGVRSETRETTVIYDNDGKDDVMANSDIINDIKDLHNRDTVVYIHTNSTVDKTDEAWHVYPISATTGTVKDYSKTRGTITMADDTVLELSVFVKDNIWDVIKRNAVVALRLDTHGHVIDANAKAVRVIGYFTGTSRVTSAHDAWFHDWTYAAQFVDVTTGEPIEVPVTNTVANQLERTATNNNTNGYYDITTAVYNKTALTSATELFESNNIYASAYALKTGANNSATFTASSFMFNTTKNNGAEGLKVFYDNDSVKIFVASDRGTDLTVTPYDGVDDMIEKLSDGFTAKAVYLENIIVSGSYDPSTDAFYADTIFAFEAATASSGYLFLPESISAGALDSETITAGQVWRFEGAYLNGSSVSDWIYVDSNNGYDRGFYNFTVTNNVYHLEKAEPIVDYIYDQVNVYKHPTNSAFYFDPVSEGATRLVSSEATIVELREEAGKLIVDSVESLDDFWYSDYSDYANALLQVGYTWDANGVVDVIYVVNQKYGTVIPQVQVDRYWTDNGIYTFEDKVVFPIYFDESVDLEEGAELVLKNQQQYKYGETADGWSAYAAAPDGVGVVKKDADGDLYIEATIDIAAPGHYNYGVKVTGIYWPDITITNKATDFTFSMSKVPGDNIETTNNTYVVEDLEVGQSFSIGLSRDTVADGIKATVDMTGIADREVKFTSHQVWMSVTPSINPTNNAIVIESVMADFTFSLGEATGNPATNYEFVNGDSAANFDVITFSEVPGTAKTVQIKRSDNNLTGTGLLTFTVKGETIRSTQAIGAVDPANQVFTFTFVPMANSMSATSVDTQTENLEAQA